MAAQRRGPFSGDRGQNNDRNAGGWTEITGEARFRWGTFPDDELDIADGHQGKPAAIMQGHQGRTEDDAQRDVAAFLSRC